MVQVFNPLKSRCGITPDYVSSEDFGSFLAHGLMKCWLGSDENDPDADCDFSRPITREDVRQLREKFLDLVEGVIYSIWEETSSPGDGWLDVPYDAMFLDPGDSDEWLNWSARLDENSVLFELECTGNGKEEIWLSYGAVKHRVKVLKILEEARAAVGGTVWDKLVKLV